MTSNFDPKSKITKTQGKDYLEVKWRIVWFREEHPKGGIVTEVINEDLIKATIIDSEGKVLATGHGSSKKQGVAKTRPYEGAETAAIGRALAHAGYGTQFTEELEEGTHLADSPVEPKKKELTEPEKKTFLLDTFSKLVARAKTIGLTLEPMNAGWGIDEMKAHYAAQKEIVSKKELG